MTGKENRLMDEYVEALWILQERGETSWEALQGYVTLEFDQHIWDLLTFEGLAAGSAEEGTAVLTDAGRRKGSRIIRAHRLAERLLYDVLKLENYELAACEFEHIIDTDLIDALCTLLGHPKKSPEGLPIPPGECCVHDQKTIRSPAVSLRELHPEQSGRVIAVHSDNDHQLHLLDLLQIRPGAVVRVHQTAPSFVIECDGSNIAIDEEVAGSIFVWRIRAEQFIEDTGGSVSPGPSGKKRGKRGWRKRFGV